MRKDSNSTRNLLKQLLSGERPKALITVLDISDLEACVSIDCNGMLDNSNWKLLRPHQVEAHIEQIKSEHQLYQIEINRVSRKECEAIDKRLEEEY